MLYDIVYVGLQYTSNQLFTFLPALPRRLSKFKVRKERWRIILVEVVELLVGSGDIKVSVSE